ncbi:hypothetical protein ACLOJK_021578 [Asimina triloba]
MLVVRTTATAHHREKEMWEREMQRRSNLTGDKGNDRTLLGFTRFGGGGSRFPSWQSCGDGSMPDFMRMNLLDVTETAEFGATMLSDIIRTSRFDEGDTRFHGFVLSDGRSWPLDFGLPERKQILPNLMGITKFDFCWTPFTLPLDCRQNQKRGQLDFDCDNDRFVIVALSLAFWSNLIYQSSVARDELCQQLVGEDEFLLALWGLAASIDFVGHRWMTKISISVYPVDEVTGVAANGLLMPGAAVLPNLVGQQQPEGGGWSTRSGIDFVTRVQIWSVACRFAGYEEEKAGGSGFLTGFENLYQ